MSGRAHDGTRVRMDTEEILPLELGAGPDETLGLGPHSEHKIDRHFIHYMRDRYLA